jgi:transcription-repair coupling factor (superfamily II helicase)
VGESFYRSLLERFINIEPFRQFVTVAGTKSLTLTGLNQFGRVLMLAGLRQQHNKPIVLITKNDQEVFKIQKLLSELWNIEALIYPPLRSDSLNRQEFITNFQQRILVGEQMHRAGVITLFSGRHLIEPLSVPSTSLRLSVGDDISPIQLMGDLSALGFERQVKVFQIGEIANRGEVVDIFPLSTDTPWRITFAGNKIEQIYTFDPLDGRKGESYQTIEVPSLKIKNFAPTLAEFLEEHRRDFLVVMDHSEEILQSLYEIFMASENVGLVSLNQSLNRLPIIKIETIASTETDQFNFEFLTPPIYSSQIDRLVKDTKKYLAEGWTVAIATDKDRSITQIFNEANVAVDVNPILLPAISGIGTIIPLLKTLILTDEEIFAIVTHSDVKTSTKQQRVFMAEIQRGDYIVHTDHGIGRLTDVQKISLSGIEREYLILDYAKGDKLYVPVDQIDKISKYVSVDGREPQLTRLSSQSWKRVISKIRKESHKFAKELLDLYAKRQLSHGISFDADLSWEKALADSFAYQETPDQETVINEILRDMERDKPMDRLLVADVGFGKTEVAIRAGFKAATSGYQVAVLAPTTILVEQHYKTFTERLKSFDVKIAALSRFKSKSEQAQTVAQVKLGEVDIVIGTHRLLSKDIRFKNLGLIIIDEEQRFGVAHKEKLKLLRSEVDVLSLTATPIPRTLNLALSGIRDISVIETPPTNRLPIITSVVPYSSNTVKDAIEREIKRSGQVYFIHNRVQTIDTVQHRLEQLMPEIKFVHAHGQMSERMLAKIMQDFNQHKYDVLIASTIIENGIDNPNVNTLIVDDAGRFGLSQLHQLRGRIGRGQVQGYATFMYNKGKMSERALERLRTIQEHTDLGSGYNIAMRDMQIRGAGGVLSKQQHGHITAIGLSLYTKLINKAVEEMRSGQKIDVSDVTIDLPVSAYLPVKYVDAESQRLKIYQTLGTIEDKKLLNEEFKRLEENYGKLPVEVANLKKLLHLKLTALSTQMITAITARNLNPSNLAPLYQITIQFTKPLKPKTLEPIVGQLSSLQIGEKDIKFNHSDFGGDWLDGLTRLVEQIHLV